ncbi:MAG: hypothetical protein A4S09_12905 [Proteobacteria bacterium SG_bin7]|nr:MAG: hypothetical protein A4S09_12905 [Proteobacteria bacterium SG_bin7]
MSPLAIGAIITGLGVILGAFGAHALKTQLTPESLAVFETGVRYQMYHGLGIIALAANPLSKHFRSAIQCLTLGTVIFSGSLYALVFTNLKIFGAITPMGGTLLIIGWILIAIKALHK